jgi:eukaryotic-like serine/threonine-protein kinase
MEAALWLRIEPVIDEILATIGENDGGAVQIPIDSPSVSEVLDRTCSGDPELRAQVVAFLEAEAHVGFLESDAVSFSAPELGNLAPLEIPADTGDRIGPWRLEREIGRGGTSVVYLARRDDEQFEQQVAIKLLGPFGHATDRMRRFEAERRILASLDHPGIARIHDGGVTDRGVAAGLHAMGGIR